jgi:hypothetical protein
MIFKLLFPQIYNHKHLNDQEILWKDISHLGVSLDWNGTIFHSDAGRYFIFNFSKLNVTEINSQAIWIIISECYGKIVNLFKTPHFPQKTMAACVLGVLIVNSQVIHGCMCVRGIDSVPLTHMQPCITWLFTINTPNTHAAMYYLTVHYQYP